MFFDLVVVAVVAVLTRIRIVVLAMFLIVLMAATVPTHRPKWANFFTAALLIVRAGDESVPTGRWVLCTGLAVHFLAGGIGGLVGNAPWKWVLLWALLIAVSPVVLGVVGQWLNNIVIGCLLLVPMLGQVGYGLVLSRHRDEERDVDHAEARHGRQAERCSRLP